MRKLVIVGIDGGSPYLVNKWIDKLPAFRYLKDNGSFSVMKSTIPPMTCPSWACMFTGLNPAELGMFFFIDYNGGIKVHNSQSWIYRSIWSELNGKGLKVGLINIPLTYPVWHINGYVIAGLMTPPGVRYYYPDSLKLNGYTITPDITLTEKGRGEEYRELIMESLLQRRTTILKMMLNHPVNVLALSFFASDLASHYFWDKPDIIFDVYKEIDLFLGTVIDRNFDVMVVSDHGFQPYKKRFLINSWLEQNGYLTYKTKKRKPSYGYILSEKIRNKLPSSVVKNISRGMGDNLRNVIMKTKMNTDNGLDTLSNIDWENTLAYSYGVSGLVYLTDDSKELQYEIGKKLSKVKNEGCSLSVHYKQDIYSGSFYNIAPHIVVVGNNCSPFVGKDDFGIWADGLCSGMHHMDGLFMCSKKIESKDMVVQDVAHNIMKWSKGDL